MLPCAILLDPPPHPLHLLANAFVPALLLLTILVSIANARRNGVALAGWIARVAVAMLIVFILAHVNRWLKLWSGHTCFPSGHVSAAACLCTAICFCAWRWLPLLVTLVILVAGYSWLIVGLGFHTWMDIAGAVAVAPPLTWVILTWKKNRQGEGTGGTTLQGGL